MALHNLTSFHATIGGYSTGDSFDLAGFGYRTSETDVFSANAGHTSGILTVTDGTQTARPTLIGYATSNFALSSDNNGGTLVEFVK